MSELDPELENRLNKLLMSSVLRTLEALHPDVDVHASVRQNMLEICAGVRERALAAAVDDPESATATAFVDKLTKHINDYLDYSGSPLATPVKLVKRAE
jgi:hypothetical protein